MEQRVLFQGEVGLCPEKFQLHLIQNSQGAAIIDFNMSNI